MSYNKAKPRGERNFGELWYLYKKVRILQHFFLRHGKLSLKIPPLSPPPSPKKIFESELFSQN